MQPLHDVRSLIATCRAGVLLLIAALAIAPSIALPASMVEFSDEQLVKQSVRVLEGHVTDLRCAWNANGTQIHTTITIDVSHMYKGVMPAGRRLVFDQLGGQVGDMVMDIIDQPAFKKDEDVILFLRDPAQAVNTPVVGMNQGKLTIAVDPNTGTSMIVERGVVREGFVRNLTRLVMTQEGGR